jgi:transposase
MPHGYPPWPTVYYHFRLWHHTSVWERIVMILRERLRVCLGGEPTPSAGVIDSCVG